MTSSDFERLQSLFEEGLRIPLDGRPAFLASVGGDNPELRTALERLLEASATQNGFITGAVRGALSAASGAEPELQPGTRLGDYRVVRHLNSGGMAHVYLAERADDEFRKQAAIKVIQSSLADAGFEQRFRLERQILASLEHPNCCRLLDGGVTADGRPYLVMEFVDGESIAAYAAGQKLESREILALFRQLCSAVEYAHSNLIIHRDIKPGNVLVTSTGMVKLMDFGIAKLLRADASPVSAPASDLTAPLDRMATPAYASPEQLRGDVITTGADIYSLGILLEELLTGGKRPDAGTAATAGLSRELQAILHRATHPEAARRYRSVGQFSEDIGRYLDGYPILAKADSWAYRASKFVLRNRAAVAAGCLVIVVLLAGLFATFREQRRTKQRFDEVRYLATVFLFDFDAAIRDLPGATAARQALVERALKTLETLSRDSERDESLQVDLADAYHKVATIQWNTGSGNLGDREGAAASLGREIAIRDAIARRSPANTRNAADLANAYSRLSTVVDRGNPQLAQAHVAKATGLLAGLSKRYPDDSYVGFSWANQLSVVSLNLHRSGHLQESLAERRRSVELLRHVVDRNPDDLQSLRYLGWFHIYAGDILGGGGAELQMGDRAGALVEMRQALEIFNRIAGRNPTSGAAVRDRHSAIHRIASIEEMTGDLEAAIRSRRGVLSGVDALRDADPKSREAARDAAIAHSSLGLLLTKANRLGEAEIELRRAEALDEDRLRRFPQDPQSVLDIANVQQNLAGLLQKKGRLPAATAYWKRALASREKALAANPEDSRLLWRQATTYYALATALEHTPDREGARAAFLGASRAYTQLQATGQLSPHDQDVLGKIARSLQSLPRR